MDQPAAPSLLDTVRRVLAEEIRHPGMERFALAARLREDLGIDSVILMELLVRLETGHGFEVPKTALDSARLITIGDLLAQ
ncbi:MAG: phosphopantetheine-binding protein, partial [Aurantimonas coralicida]